MRLIYTILELIDLFIFSYIFYLNCFLFCFKNHYQKGTIVFPIKNNY